MNKPLSEIISVGQANKAMREIDQIDASLALSIADETGAVVEVRARYHTGVEFVYRKKLNKKRQELSESIEIYADRDRKFWKKKSIKTPFGNFGFRSSTPSVSLIKKTAKTFKDALELIKKSGIGFVRKVEELDKDEILSSYAKKLLNDDLLAKVGLKVNSGELFFIKTNSAKELKEALDHLKNS